MPFGEQSVLCDVSVSRVEIGFVLSCRELLKKLIEVLLAFLLSSCLLGLVPAKRISMLIGLLRQPRESGALLFKGFAQVRYLNLTFLNCLSHLFGHARYLPDLVGETLPVDLLPLRCLRDGFVYQIHC
ncbi:hypothetical protein D3C81_1483310 [compost metagenome]